jgi:hypothetical protein
MLIGSFNATKTSLKEKRQANIHDFVQAILLLRDFQMQSLFFVLEELSTQFAANLADSFSKNSVLFSIAQSLSSVTLPKIP